MAQPLLRGSRNNTLRRCRKTSAGIYTGGERGQFPPTTSISNRFSPSIIWARCSIILVELAAGIRTLRFSMLRRQKTTQLRPTAKPICRWTTKLAPTRSIMASAKYPHYPWAQRPSIQRLRKRRYKFLPLAVINSGRL